MPISTPKKVGIGALALLGAFVLGYVPASLSAQAAQANRIGSRTSLRWPRSRSSSA